MRATEGARARDRIVRTDHDRFVGFAFASADLMVECDAEGTIRYATGAFPSAFGRPATAFLGRPLHDLVSPADHPALADGLLLLTGRGRLLPMTVRLANSRRTPLALAGLRLPEEHGLASLCLSFAPLPSPPAGALPTARSLGRVAEARLRAGADHGQDALHLIELGSPGRETVSATSFGTAMESIAPGSLTGEIAPGRFGVLGEADALLQIAARLEQALRAQGMPVTVAASGLSLARDGLSANQAARALRHALAVFARSGGTGLSGAGFAQGLAGYLHEASRQLNAVRRSIWAGRFGLAFQPIVSLADDRVHHYEALIRPHPIPGCPFEGAQDFILLVETLGIAEEVDLVIAQKACDAAEAANAAVAINLSGQSVESAGFRRRLLDLFNGHRATRSGRISVELTETAHIDDLDEVGRTTAALRALGVPFCLDDFGSGAADVRRLRVLGADIVKIDGSYTHGAVQDGRERAFVAGMIDIARNTGAKVVAERVETEAEADAMKALGADYGQGWAFGRPGPLPPVLSARQVVEVASDARSFARPSS